MRRTLHTRLTGTLTGPTTVYAIVAAATTYAPAQESLVVTLDGRPAEVQQLLGPHGTRLHRFAAAEPTDAPVEFALAYNAVIDGAGLPPVHDPVDLPTYLRPSRYCESDRHGGLVAEHFGGHAGTDLMAAIGDWIRGELSYVAGSTGPSDSATDVLASRQGVCRDFAHVAVTLLRAANMPARFASVWAPGLQPMEFHAVAEAWVGDRWVVLDATDLAPRPAMVRIATGRDAADTAFLSSYGRGLVLEGFTVRADADEMPGDDSRAMVLLN